MKKYILLTMLLSCAIFVYAQDDGDIDEGYGPKKGDWTVEMQFGRVNYGSGVRLPEAVGADSFRNDWNVYNNTPNFYAVNNVGGADASNMIGIKSGYYLSDKVSLILSGAMSIRKTPGQVNVPGFIDPDGPNAAWIPAYAAIPEVGTTNLVTTIGGEYTFSTELERFFPYVGVHVPFTYSRISEYDPTIGEYVSDTSPSSPVPSNNNLIYDLGVRHGEVFGFGTQLVAGANYYLMEGLYFGFEIRPFSYMYAFSSSSPGPGLENLESSTSVFSFFTQPFMKVGFKF